jgi:CheY-like chemotaxis protein/HPt (histidine-containing phosphotransfer) domain-containing protein
VKVERPLRLLLAEDTPVNREVAIGMLEQLGHRVDIAENGREAVEAAAKTVYDAIFMDCQMPDVDGFQATRLIRLGELSGRSNRRVPIIALTAHAMKSDRDACLAAGMDHYLSKPFTQAQLRVALSQVVKPVQPGTIQKEFQMNEQRPKVAGHAIPNRVLPGEEGGPTSDRQSVDRAALDRLRALERPGKPGVFAKIVNQFLTSAQESVELLREAVRSGSAQQLEVAAHRLKSSSAQLGALILAGRCHELELLGRAQSLEGAQDIFTHLEREYQTVSLLLRAELDATKEGAR